MRCLNKGCLKSEMSYSSHRYLMSDFQYFYTSMRYSLRDISTSDIRLVVFDISTRNLQEAVVEISMSGIRHPMKRYSKFDVQYFDNRCSIFRRAIFTKRYSRLRWVVLFTWVPYMIADIYYLGKRHFRQTIIAFSICDIRKSIFWYTIFDKSTSDIRYILIRHLI